MGGGFGRQVRGAALQVVASGGVCQRAENPLLIKAARRTVCQRKILILLARHVACPIVAFKHH